MTPQLPHTLSMQETLTLSVARVLPLAQHTHMWRMHGAERVRVVVCMRRAVWCGAGVRR